MPFGPLRAQHRLARSIDRQPVAGASLSGAARAVMQMVRGDTGRVLCTTPTVTVVSPQFEDAALDVLNAPLPESGGTTKWAGTAERVLTPHVVV